jgi:hypothetical protein
MGFWGRDWPDSTVAASARQAATAAGGMVGIEEKYTLRHAVTIGASI